MNVATIPPGGVAYAHIHVGFEVMLYILEGRVRHEYGDGLTQTVENTAGDFIFIEPGVPHEVFNVSDTEPVVAVVARSDASEWQNIIPYRGHDSLDPSAGRQGSAQSGVSRGEPLALGCLFLPINESTSRGLRRSRIEPPTYRRRRRSTAARRR